jgi:hypothetical protein
MQKIMIGVADWSRYDDRLLEKIKARCPLQSTGIGKTLTGSTEDVQVEIFDACSPGETPEQEELLSHTFHQTPIVGYWVDGQRVDMAWGLPGRELVYKVLRIIIT